MKLNPKYVLREIAGETILVSLADLTSTKRLLCLNELGTSIYKLLLQGLETEEILENLMNEYDVEEAVLKADMDEFIETLKGYEVIF